MDTLINLILAAALQFTGVQVAQHQQELNHQNGATIIETCCKTQKTFTVNNELNCKETNTQ